MNNPNGVGHKATGEPCNSIAEKATFRCHVHGGKTPVALYKAKEAMALLRLPAIESLHHSLSVLTKILEQYEMGTCLACGFPSGDVDEIQAVAKACSVIVRQAQTVLDRTEIGPKATLEITRPETDLDLDQLTEAERARLATLYAEFKGLKEDVRQRLFGQSSSPTQIM
jgi:hypothetical protein